MGVNIMKKQVLLIIMSSFLISCVNSNNSTGKSKENIRVSDSKKGKAKEKVDFLKKWDLDGDGINDNILLKYSGGGHCCYKIVITLSSDKIKRKYPFEMDGGYISGVDNSKPYHFNIKDYDNDGLPEIYMEIFTYNGTKKPIEKRFTKEYGIKTNYIIFDFKNNFIIVKDFKI
jgi:hypothetical protein